MANELHGSLSLENLRRAAEIRLRETDSRVNKDGFFDQMLEDLRLHKVELEMQNEELLRINFEAEIYSSLYRDLFEFAPIGFFLITDKGIIKNANEAAAALLMENKEQIINKRIQSFVNSEYYDSFFFFLQHVLKSGQKETIELRLLKKNGSYAYVILESIKLFNQNKSDPNILVASIDITERKNAAEALLRAHKQLDAKVKERTKELEDANQALRAATEENLVQANKLKEVIESKDKFFAIIAHDLKNTLMGLKGYSQLLSHRLEKLSKEDLAQYVNNINNYTNNLDKLLNDLLSWSTLQLGHITYHPGNLNVCDIINETLEIFSVVASEKKITLTSNYTTCPFLYGDENMIKSILRNLVSNALKFTHEGGEVSIKTEDLEEYILVAVADNGKGMTPKIKNKLFKIDEKIASLGTAREPGNGLGLILCKEFVEKHEGSIWFESEEGKGTSFYFTLPKPWAVNSNQ